MSKEVPQRLIVEYAGQEQNKIEKVERNKKMILYLSNKNLPETAILLRIPKELQSDQSKWNKSRKITPEVGQFKTYDLKLMVFNERNCPIDQCTNCYQFSSQPENSKNFVLTRCDQVLVQTKRIPLPVIFKCCPSHQDSCNLDLVIQLIDPFNSTIEFTARVPLIFKKHKRKSPHLQSSSSSLDASSSSSSPSPPSSSVQSSPSSSPSLSPRSSPALTDEEGCYFPLTNDLTSSNFENFFASLDEFTIPSSSPNNYAPVQSCRIEEQQYDSNYAGKHAQVLAENESLFYNIRCRNEMGVQQAQQLKNLQNINNSLKNDYHLAWNTFERLQKQLLEQQKDQSRNNDYLNQQLMCLEEQIRLLQQETQRLRTSGKQRRLNDMECIGFSQFLPNQTAGAQ